MYLEIYLSIAVTRMINTQNAVSEQGLDCVTFILRLCVIQPECLDTSTRSKWMCSNFRTGMVKSKLSELFKVNTVSIAMTEQAWL